LARLLAIAGLLGILFFVPTEAQAACGSNGNFLGGGACTGDGALQYFYVASNETFYQVPRRPTGRPETEPDEPGRHFEWGYIQHCGSAGPVYLCTPEPCVAAGGATGLVMMVYRREMINPPTAWEYRGNVCQAAAAAVPMDDVVAAVEARLREELYKNLAHPEILVNPSPRALVNLPVIVSTEDPGPQSLEFTTPLPGTIDAEPSYAWTWSDGHTSEGSGRAYTQAVSPTRNPDYYVAHTYRSSGPAGVTLTVIWRATATVNGAGTVPLDPIEFTAASAFDVLEARSRLVAGGD